MAQRVLLLLALFALSARDAHAQSWRHPPITDYDHEAEQHSEFWEQALSADTEDYRSRIAHSLSLWAQGGKSERTRAIESLRAARDAHPGETEAHYWLGELHFERRDFDACARSLARLFSLEPGYKPKKARKGRAPDYTLASCHLYAGNYQEATALFKRIKSLRYGSSKLELRLSEALMAQGRLDEAIEVLRQTVRRTSRSEPRFALAVALDRAEELSESTKILGQAVSKDPGLATLVSIDKVFAPPEDEHYYLGLGHRGAGRLSRSLYHFRRYLHDAPKSPWSARARAHIQTMGSIRLGADVKVLGSANWKKQDLTEAIRHRRKALLDCVGDHDLLLLQVSVSSVRRRKVGDGSGVRVTVLAQEGLDSGSLRKAVECTEASAKRIVVPRLRGPDGSYAHAEFTLIRGQR